MKKSLLATTAGLALAVPMTAPALASDHEDEAKTKGMCSVSSHWELKAETDDDGEKVEFEVDSRTAGQSWDYVISGPAGELAAGTATTDDEGEFEVEVITSRGSYDGSLWKDITSGSITDAFTAVATTTDETCDSTVGIGQDSDDDEYDDEDSADDDSDEGKCTATSTIVLTVDKSGHKVVRKGSAKTKGKKAVFQVHARTKGKGALTADAQRSDHSEECTTDDQYDD